MNLDVNLYTVFKYLFSSFDRNLRAVTHGLVHHTQQNRYTFFQRRNNVVGLRVRVVVVVGWYRNWFVMDGHNNILNHSKEVIINFRTCMCRCFRITIAWVQGNNAVINDNNRFCCSWCMDSVRVWYWLDDSDVVVTSISSRVVERLRTVNMVHGTGGSNLFVDRHDASSMFGTSS